MGWTCRGVDCRHSPGRSRRSLWSPGGPCRWGAAQGRAGAVARRAGRTRASRTGYNTSTLVSMCTEMCVTGGIFLHIYTGHRVIREIQTSKKFTYRYGNFSTRREICVTGGIFQLLE